LGVVLGGAAVLVACATARYFWGTSAARAEPAATAAAPSDAAPASQAVPASSSRGSASYGDNVPVPDIVAAINGHTITRTELATECRIHYGKDVLESLVNKYLILAECRRLGISVSHREVDEEIEQMAHSFNLPVDQWLKMLQQERGIKPHQYANDIIWPSIALRKLAGKKLQVTEQELTEAYEIEYGPAVKARIIVCSKEDKAREAQARAAAKPDDFGNLAKEYSEDAPSASVKGLVQPIRKHGPCPEIEQSAFALANGQVSDVIRSQGQFVVLKREGQIAARKEKLSDVAPRLEQIIRDKKLRSAAGDIFKELQKRTKVQNVYNDERLQQQVGRDVVALVNGAPIYMRQLDDECLARHGPEVLQGLIGRRMLELECTAKQFTVTDQEIDSEIAHLASQMMRPLPDGSPDVKGWLGLATKQQSVTIEVYRREIVWPSVALKKLTGGRVDVTPEDLKKGFEANYGPRARCRAIVLNNLRRAQEVWDAARKPVTGLSSEENFAELATKYSIERTSRANGGLVPPIRRHGSQPMLEEEAFALKPGDISGVINVDDKFIVLYCIGFTTPIQVDFNTVKKDIEDDIREKKQRLAMAEYYQHLEETTTVDNFLEPELSRSPKGNAGRPTAGPAVPTNYLEPAQQR
jgi:parvulin-like peptidyl-prolyl isomerase